MNAVHIHHDNYGKRDFESLYKEISRDRERRAKRLQDRRWRALKLAEQRDKWE